MYLFSIKKVSNTENLIFYYSYHTTEKYFSEKYRLISVNEFTANLLICYPNNLLITCLAIYHTAVLRKVKCPGNGILIPELLQTC